MIVSFALAIYFKWFHEGIFQFSFKPHEELLLSIAITTSSWILITLLTKPTKKEIFPVDVRVNINTASARQLADALPGVGLKTAREIKDLQSSMLGEKFIKLEQLRAIKRIDWDELIKDNLIRVE